MGYQKLLVAFLILVCSKDVPKAELCQTQSFGRNHTLKGESYTCIYA